MIRTLALLLPAIIPSWRFFDIIAPSPRIEVALLRSAQDADLSWREFMPTPDNLSLRDQLMRLIWNPKRNAKLYLVSCTESVLADGSPIRLNHLLEAIRSAYQHEETLSHFQMRLILLSRTSIGIEREEVFRSSATPLRPERL